MSTNNFSTPWSTVRYDERWREKLDEELIELLDLLNQLGLRTTYSCCGHGDEDIMIWFDGDCAPDHVFERFGRFLIANHEKDDSVSYLPWMSKVIRPHGVHEWQLLLKNWDVWADTPVDECHPKTLAIIEAVSKQLRVLTSEPIVAYHAKLDQWLNLKPTQPPGYGEYCKQLDAWLDNMPDCPEPYEDYKFPESDEPDYPRRT